MAIGSTYVRSLPCRLRPATVMLITNLPSATSVPAPAVINFSHTSQPIVAHHSIAIEIIITFRIAPYSLLWYALHYFAHHSVMRQLRPRTAKTRSRNFHTTINGSLQRPLHYSFHVFSAVLGAKSSSLFPRSRLNTLSDIPQYHHGWCPFEISK